MGGRSGRRRRATVRRILVLAGILVVAVALAVGGAAVLERWEAGVVAANLDLSERAARQLVADSADFLDQVSGGDPGGDPRWYGLPRDVLDRRLAEISDRSFAIHRGAKGGFWLPHLQDFLGYADPASPPPKPAFGPPPRSYRIILDQVLESIRTEAAIARLHQFDPAVFTLATVPVVREGRVVAVVWARVHIERELPAWKLGRYLQAAAGLTLFGFLVVLVVTVNQRRETRSLSAGLRTIQEDPAFRLPGRSGMYGTIRRSINAMVDSLEQAHQERKALEARLHQRDKMEALGKLLAGVAHEVKTPLAILKTRVQIWQRDLARFSARTGQESPLSDDSLQIVLDEINRLSDLVTKLLYFSRPHDPERMQPQDINDLLRHTVLLVKPRLLQQKTDVDLDLAADAPSVLGDAGPLHQVFLNLLTNSLQAMGRHGRVAVSTRTDRTAGTVRVDVRDTGPGIAPDIMAQVFDPFFTTRHGGTGMGLSIAYEIVRAHGGEIRFVAPADGRGAHCVVTLPLQPRTEEPA